MRIAILIASMAMVMFSGCVHQVVMKSPMVSMTETDPPRKMKKLGKVSTKYCIGDPAKVKTGNIVGLMDEAIHKAQSKKKADYIKDAVFTREQKFMGKNCMKIDGIAIKSK